MIIAMMVTKYPSTFRHLSTNEPILSRADLAKKKFNSTKHKYHLVSSSPLPFLIGVFLLFTLIPLVFYFHQLTFAGRNFLLQTALILFLVTLFT